MNGSWPIKCFHILPKFIQVFRFGELLGTILFGGELESIAILQQHF